MKKIILVIGLMGFLAVPTSVGTVENPVIESEPEIWLMSIELCQKFSPEIEAAIKRGVLFLPRQCKWFGMGTHSPFNKDELAIWPTLKECDSAPITPPKGYMVRNRKCQKMNQ